MINDTESNINLFKKNSTNKKSIYFGGKKREKNLHDFSFYLPCQSEMNSPFYNLSFRVSFMEKHKTNLKKDLFHRLKKCQFRNGIFIP